MTNNFPCDIKVFLGARRPQNRQRPGAGANLKKRQEPALFKPIISNTLKNRENEHYDKGDCDCAIADYDQSIRLKPDDADAFNNPGNAYQAKGDTACAIVNYRKALSLNPNNEFAHANLESLGETP